MYKVVPGIPGTNLVENTIRKYYGNWLLVDKSTDKYSYNIIIEKNCKPRVLSPNTVIACIDKDDPWELVRSIEYARALLRQWIVWRGDTYVLAGEGEELIDYEVHPAYDIFIWRNKLETRILDEKGIVYGSNPLLHKRFGGVHIVYSGNKPVARLEIPDEGFSFKAIQLSRETTSNDLAEFLEANRGAILSHIYIARKFLDSLGKPDIVIVSFSGGKDSLVVLDLAVKHYGRDIVLPVYVDTGVDFPITRKYVEEVSRYYGVDIRVEYAPVKENVEKHGLPTKTNRWCTLLKTSAFNRVVNEYLERGYKVLVLVGDRDAESEKRARKPPVRKRKRYLEATPIKQWSTIHVQLYTWINKLPENPLYRMGFYRLGCYICPALTSLEKYVMIEKLYDQLRDKPWFKEFINENRE